MNFLFTLNLPGTKGCHSVTPTQPHTHSGIHFISFPFLDFNLVSEGHWRGKHSCGLETERIEFCDFTVDAYCEQLLCPTQSWRKTMTFSLV